MCSVVVMVARQHVTVSLCVIIDCTDAPIRLCESSG
jgi:hypothetical protein